MKGEKCLGVFYVDTTNFLKEDNKKMAKQIFRTKGLFK